LFSISAMTNPAIISSPAEPALHELCSQLRELSLPLEQELIQGATAWPRKQLELCGDYGVFQWFLPTEVGGQNWKQSDIVRGYLALSAACLTTTFVITQATGACGRIGLSENESLKRRVLGDLMKGSVFATLGVSHLTTSRRHLDRPVMHAEALAGGGYRLDGFSPWVTGAAFADYIVLGATQDDGRQILALLPARLPGVKIPPAEKLVALTASQTGPVHCANVEISEQWVLAGPMPDIMTAGSGGSTGGLQTSTLAVGLAEEAIRFLEQETECREDLRPVAGALRAESQELREDLLLAAEGSSRRAKQQLRVDANSLVLRTTQAALTAAKGTGYVAGHPAGRWCREAMFFLVWSCPHPVMAANLCELAGLAD
jgi:alkylation response protein AidB-like acyl-CoA dehydrogenase